MTSQGADTPAKELIPADIRRQAVELIHALSGCYGDETTVFEAFADFAERDAGTSKRVTQIVVAALVITFGTCMKDTPDPDNPNTPVPVDLDLTA